MATHDHLELLRIILERPRRKRGFGVPIRLPNIRRHGELIREAVSQAETRTQVARGLFPGIDPALVLVFELQSAVDDERWADYGVTLVEKDETRVIGLFRNAPAKELFQQRLSGFTDGLRTRRPDQIYPNDYGFFSALREARPLNREDKVGSRLLGIDLSQLPVRSFDVEFWHPGERQRCNEKLSQLQSWVATQVNARIADSFIGDSLFIVRLIAPGTVLDTLLDLPDVRRINLPPSPNMTHGDAFAAPLAVFEQILAPPNDAPGIVVIDSGVRTGHPFLGPAVGEATYFLTQTVDADDVTSHGHGTKVAGLALYGDVNGCFQTRTFVPTLRLYSGRVLNSENEFDDEKLIVEQMRDAITYFKETYGCRVFNLSLGAQIAHADRKSTPWAWILDHLAREFDVIIVVSAGNLSQFPEGRLVIDHYPAYLLEDAARVGEPAIAAIPITVGSLVEHDNVPQGRHGNDPAYRQVASRGQPSPFTRSGPGLRAAIKPELCDYGGGGIFDARMDRVISSDGYTGILSLNRNFAGSSLFAVGSGTSFAAPRVAHIAALLVREYPNAPANLIRALVANSARHSPEARELFGTNFDQLSRLCGYGRPDKERAFFSDDHRATLHASDDIALDTFHLYRVPIADDFRHRRGERRIIVTLAFDPPTRHTRYDYLGCSMEFRLLRSYSVEQICRAFEPKDQVQDALSSFSEMGKHDLSPTKRENSTLQQAIFTFRGRISDDHGDEYILLLRCKDHWINKERNPTFRQRYAVVVTLEHDDPGARIYAQARARAQADRLRIRRET